MRHLMVQTNVTDQWKNILWYNLANNCQMMVIGISYAMLKKAIINDVGQYYTTKQR